MMKSLAALLALFASGCAVGPNFAPPKPDMPAAWARAPAVTASQAAPDLARWWDQFGDPELSRLEARAASDNLGVRQAVARIEEARAQRRMLAAGAWPQIDLTGGYQNTRISERTATTSLLASLGGKSKSGAPGGVAAAIPGLKNPFDQYQYGLSASWELDLFGRVRRAVEAADADTEAAAWDARAVRVSLAAEVALAYVDLRSAQARRRIAQDSLDTSNALQRLAEDARRSELGSDLDVAEAASAAAAAQAQLPPLDQEIAIDKDQLALLLARKPGELDGELAGDAAIPPAPPQVPAGLPADLTRRRPDVRAAEATLHAATARQGVAVASLFPSVSLNAGAGFQASRPAALVDWAARYFTIGPSLDLPVFDAGQRRANVRLQGVRAREAALAYAQTVLTALQEANDAMAACSHQHDQVTALQASADQARLALDLAQKRYRAGSVSFRDVLDAEAALDRAQSGLAAATAAASADIVTLYRALGGGWDERPAT